MYINFILLLIINNKHSEEKKNAYSERLQSSDYTGYLSSTLKKFTGENFPCLLSFICTLFIMYTFNYIIIYYHFLV